MRPSDRAGEVAPDDGVPADLRAPALALVAWAAALVAFLARPWLVAMVLAAGVVVIVARRRRSGAVTATTWLLGATAVVASVWLHVAAVRASPVTSLARDRATVTGTLVVSSDPVRTKGAFGSGVWFRASAREVVGRGQRHRVRAPVLVLAPRTWATARLGSAQRFVGRLQQADGADLAAVLVARGPPTGSTGTAPLLAAADRVRAGIRAAVARQPPEPRALVPALVDGDDARLPDALVADFRTAGLTHLVAVSGTNLTLVVGFLLVVARWAGVRARGLVVVGGLGVAGFVLLARAEPSVLRAAVMGSVALVGMGSAGRERGCRALGVAVLVLLLVDPWLARSVGFALSAAATAGILFLAPGWRDALGRWLPRWAAEAVAVPLAAQLACTPLVAAIAGQVSLVAVLANMLVAALVGPATVCGLLGGLVAVVAPLPGRLVAAPAGWCASWIVLVARHTASLPVAALGWSTGPVALLVLTAGCVAAAFSLRPLLLRRGPTLAATGVLVAAMLVPLPTPGWPPRGWVMVMCDVGQGDGLVLNAGTGAAVVVDAGPDPRPMAGCLRRLGVQVVPLVVLTHFHADHVDGLAAVLHGRRVGRIEVSPYADPYAGAHLVHALAGAAGIRVTPVRYAETWSVGALHAQVIAPSGPAPADSDSPPNDDSVVLYVVVHGLRLLLMGDEETGSQQRLAALLPGLRADVLKVAHHGSAKQDPDLVRALGARLAIISVGRHNDYGHPAPSTLRLLERARMTVRRTDLDGDIAVVRSHGLRVVTRGHAGP